MKNLLALVGLAVVAFVAAGYYLGWYSVGAQVDSQGHKELKIQVDGSKVEHDVHKGEQAVAKKLQNAGVTTSTNPHAPVAVPPPAPAPANLPGMPPGMPVSQLPANMPSMPPAQDVWSGSQMPPVPPTPPNAPVDVYTMPPR